ncbi:hypothetical protein GBW32_31290 [Streptomyces tsukubensis]|uniref:Transposase IS4 N-terminal domain-containing protein n=1 Tax=Streptomyces tsukubensis TaxID=83656 RepID=A0A1V3ZZ08_9ACTN|nr:hypothetical protein B1H18_33315 [Streptomyces tsukubensis]QFR96700.1 hypothetical protein GBW32_31290 [Streptomyces tsukubensis]
MLFHHVLPVRVMAITRTVSVAACRFVSGHLGELTAVVPFELVDAVLAETRSVRRRLRVLPWRAGIYFLLAMCLFQEVGYRLVWGKLTAGLAEVPVASPTPKAMRDLRRRLGSALVRALFEVLARPLAPADDTRCAVRAVPDCVIRRLPSFPEGPRLRAKRGLAGANLPSRLSRSGVDDAGRDRHTGLARRGVRARRRGRDQLCLAPAAAGHARSVAQGLRRQQLPRQQSVRRSAVLVSGRGGGVSWLRAWRAGLLARRFPLDVRVTDTSRGDQLGTRRRSAHLNGTHGTTRYSP